MKTIQLRRLFLITIWGVHLISIGFPWAHASRVFGQSDSTAFWDIFTDNFNSASLAAWQVTSPASLSLKSGSGFDNSIGLSVSVNSSASHIARKNLAKANEAYLSFWFNPGGVNIPDSGTTWVPGKSLAIAEIANSNTWFPPLVGLYLRRPTGQNYQVYLAWPIDSSGQRYYDYANAIPIDNGWNQITVGYHTNQWVSVWVNGKLRRTASNVVHTDPYGDTAILGMIHNSENLPSGTIRFDDVVFRIPRIADLWVDANKGLDSNTGLDPAAPLRTIQKAADQAGPGTRVHILPGIYRETVRPVLSGSSAEPVYYLAENGPGTVFLRGSEKSAALVWTQLSANSIGLPPGTDPKNIYFADLSAWNLTGAPRFLVDFDPAGNAITRLPQARAPNARVGDDWKYHEFWWSADGGAAPAPCNPATNPDPNCDKPSRSTTQLTDRSNDLAPQGVEAGNLSSLGDLTGATLTALDTEEGTFVYRRTITAHDRVNGRITLSKPCEIGSGSGVPGLGWGSKYFVEGKASLLDTPGEWWYDPTSKRLYLWSPGSENPASRSLEISRRADGFNLSNRSYIHLTGLTVELYNGSAIEQGNDAAERSYGNQLERMHLRYANAGVNLFQNVTASTSPANITDGFTLADSEIAFMDGQGLRLSDWWENNADPARFTRSGIQNTTIRNNEFHHLGFRSDDDGVGLWFIFANKLRFEGNHVYQTAQNGVQFSFSVIQSAKEYGFDPNEIKTGGILVKDNLFEKTCLLSADCAGLKIYGKAPDQHVFRDLLITGNVFRNIFGWSQVAEQRRLWSGGTNSQVHGMGGFGLYVDGASGVQAYRNIAFNNAYAGYMLYGRWRDGQMLLANNIAANSLFGMALTGEQFDTHGSVSTQLINNILINNEGFGLDLRYAAGRTANMTVDYNLYDQNGWRTLAQGGLYRAGALVVREGTSYSPYVTLSEAQQKTAWEDHGVAGSPAFWSFDPAKHDLHSGYWPDFHLTTSSGSVINRASSALPASLVKLIAAFGVIDYQLGPAYDIGRYEAGFVLLATPQSQGAEAGGSARYRLQVFPFDLPYAVTLSPVNPPARLALSLSPQQVSGSQAATLTVTNDISGAGLPGSWFDILLTGAGGGFENTTTLNLLVGGTRTYLPFVHR